MTLMGSTHWVRKAMVYTFTSSLSFEKNYIICVFIACQISFQQQLKDEKLKKNKIN